jgi:hypothetical protein
MRNIQEAVTHCIEELVLEEWYIPKIVELAPHQFMVEFRGNDINDYHVRMSHKSVVIGVQYHQAYVDVVLVEYENVNKEFAEIFCEELALAIDDSYFDDDEEDSDPEPISLQPFREEASEDPVPCM